MTPISAAPNALQEARGPSRTLNVADPRCDASVGGFIKVGLRDANSTSSAGDILLEQWSDEGRRSPGWVQKPPACDFIAYAFAPSRRWYLLPVVPLQRAWRQNGRGWIRDFGQRRVPNPGYATASVPVPIDALMPAISQAMLISI